MNLMVEKWLEYFDKKLDKFSEEYRQHQMRSFLYEFGLLHGHSLVKEAFSLLNSIHRDELANAKIIMGMKEQLLEAQRVIDKYEDAHRDPLEIAVRDFNKTVSMATKLAQARKDLREKLLSQGMSQTEAADIVDQMSDYVDMTISKGGEK